MKNYHPISMLATFLVLFISCQGQAQSEQAKEDHVYPISKTDTEWKKALSNEAYQVLRLKGTERAFSSSLNKNKQQGLYHCAGCGTLLFKSDHKFDSGTGWPSFYLPANEDCVAEESDNSYGMMRTEVLCGKCGGHLGHLFDDGPAPSGLRYCINGVSLEFKEADQ